MTEHQVSCPYAGLQPYTDAEREYFFGREEDQETVAANLVTAPLTILYGASGVGKSSVLLAGVVPFLRALPDVVVVVYREWQDQTFLASLKDRIAHAVSERTGRPFFVEDLPLDELLARAASETRATLALIFDQFEEYFLYHPEPGAGDRFDIEFARAVNRNDSGASFLLSMREDGLALLDRFQARIPNLFDNYLRIERLDRASARDAIQKPLERYNEVHGAHISIEPALVEAVLDQVRPGRVLLKEGGRGIITAGTDVEVAEHRVETPYLQLVMTRLWNTEMDAGSSVLRLATLEGLGGAEHIAETHLDNALNTLPADQQELVAQVFRHLVTPGGAKIAHSLSDLAAFAKAEQAQLEPVLVKLSDQSRRILRPVAPPPDQPTVLRYEIFHDVLAPAILRWCQEREQGEAAQQLASEARRMAEETARRRETVRLRLGAAGLAFLLIVALAAAISAFRLFGQAQGEAKVRAAAEAVALTRQAEAGEAAAAEVIARQTAEAAKNAAVQAHATAVAAKEEAVIERDVATSRQLGAQAITSLESDPQLSLLLAAEAISITHTTVADDALRRALQASQMRAILRSHVGRVNAVAFSADGGLLATGSVDGTARLWDLDGREIATFSATDMGSVVAVAFSPNSRWLATASTDGAARAWEVARPDWKPVVLEPHAGPINALAYSSDGRWLVTASADKTARIWDVGSPEEPISLEGHTDSVNAIALSPEGGRVATASLDGTARLWDLQTGAELAVLRGHTSGVNALAFSPDGTLLATSSADGTARLWDAATGLIMWTLRGHSDSVIALAFDRDGSRLVTGSADGTARLWEVASATELAVLAGHADRVNSVAFSPDGAQLATASADGSARLWDGRTGELQTILKGHTSSVNVVAFNSDGTLLVTASSDSTARLWEATGGEAQTILRKHEGSVSGLAFSPDGGLLATGGGDGYIRLWDAATVLQPGDQAIQEKAVLYTGADFYFLTFSPDGRLLATGHPDGVARVWDVRALLARDGDEAPVAVLRGHKGFVIGLAFSPDGRLLATAASDGTDPHVWDVSDVYAGGVGRELAVLEGHADGIGVAFSPNGRLLATSDNADGTVRLWSVPASSSEGEGIPKIADLSSSENLTLLAFSPDSRLLAAGGVSGPVHVWDVSTAGPGSGAEIATLRGHEGFVMNLAFSNDGDLLATASSDRTARLWDVSTLRTTGGAGAEVSVFRGHEGSVWSVAFSSDGEWLITGSDDRTVRVWTVGAEALRSAACDRATRNLTLSEWETYVASEQPYRKTCPDLPIHPSVVEAQLAWGRDYARQGKYEAALAALQRAVALDPRLQLVPEAEVAVAQGQAQAGAGDYKAALESFRRAEELDARLGTARGQEMAASYFAVCRAARAADQPETAAPACQRMEELAPRIAYGQEVTGTAASDWDQMWSFWGAAGQAVSIEMGQDRSELDSFLVLYGPDGAVIGQDDDSGGDLNSLLQEVALWETGLHMIAARGYGNSSGAYKLALRREEVSPAEAAERLLAQGRRYATEGDYEYALAALQRAAALNPQLQLVPEAEVAMAEGRAQVEAGEYEEALASFRRALALDPRLELEPEAEVAGALVAQGRAQADAGNYEGALASFQRAAALDPQLGLEPEDEVALTLVARGRAQAAAGDYAEALAALRQAEALSLQHGTVRGPELATVYLEICRADSAAIQPEAAASACQRMEALAPRIAYGQTVTGTITSGLGQAWSFEGAPGQVVSIEMGQDRGRLDSFLILYGPDGFLIDEDDDSGGGLNSLLREVALWETGLHVIVAGGSGDTSGVYRLALRREEVSPAEAAERFVAQGRRYAAAGNYEQALALLQRAAALDPQLQLAPEAEIALAQGQAQAGAGDYGAALASFRRALALDPRLPLVPEAEIAVAQGRAQADVENYAEASAALRQAEELDPQLTTVRGPELAAVYLEICRAESTAIQPEAAASACRRMEALAPRIAYGQTVTGTIAGGLGQAWSFEGAPGQVVSVEMGQDRSRLDSYLTLYGPDGALIGENDDNEGSFDSLLEEVVLWETGLHVIVAGGSGGTSGAYRLALRREEASLAEAAERLVVQGRDAAAAGNYEQALALLQRAAVLDPQLQLAPEAEVAVAQGRVQADAGDFGAALASFRRALALDPRLQLVPEAEVALVQGRMQAAAGDYEGALASYRRAAASDPRLQLVPEAEVAWIRGQARLGAMDYEGGVAYLLLALELDPTLEMSAYDLNSLCWWGSLYGRAAAVLDACEQAVALAPEDGQIRDSRGLARALTGDREGAIEDFAFYVEWCKRNDVLESDRRQREAWITALETGRDPFDAETLEALKMG